MYRQIQQVSGKTTGYMPSRFQRTGEIEERRKVGAGHDRHAHEGRFAHRCTQALEQASDLASVVRRRDDRAPARASARRIAMDVGDGVAVGKLQSGLLFEKRDHVWSGSEEGVDHGRVVMLAEFVAQVRARLLDVFDDAGASRQWIARYPRPAAGPRRGTTEQRILFNHDDFQTVPGGSDRCG